MVAADPHIAFGFLSPSGSGLKLGLAIDGAHHKESFVAAEAYFATTYTCGTSVLKVAAFDAAGFEACAYASTGDFLLHSPRDRPGCVLLDVRLPGPSGLDLQAALPDHVIDLIDALAAQAAAPVPVVVLPALLSGPARLEGRLSGAVGVRLRRCVNSPGGEVVGYRFDCPGCQEPHFIGTGWAFNGDLDRPTFSPSYLLTYTPGDPSDPDNPARRCHSFITDGRIAFCTDSTHALAGQTVDLPELP